MLLESLLSGGWISTFFVSCQQPLAAPFFSFYDSEVLACLLSSFLVFLFLKFPFASSHLVFVKFYVYLLVILMEVKVGLELNSKCPSALLCWKYPQLLLELEQCD